MSFRGNDGNFVELAKVHLLSDALNGEGEKGYRVAVMNISLEKARKIKTAPCLVNAEFDLRVGKDNKAQLDLVDIEYVQDAKIFHEQPKHQTAK